MTLNPHAEVKTGLALLAARMTFFVTRSVDLAECVFWRLVRWRIAGEKSWRRL